MSNLLEIKNVQYTVYGKDTYDRSDLGFPFGSFGLFGFGVKFLRALHSPPERGCNMAQCATVVRCGFGFRTGTTPLSKSNERKAAAA